MSSFTHLYPSFKTHPKCHLLQEIPPPQSTPKQTWSLLQLVLGIDHIPSCFHFLETISGCQRPCAPAHMSQFCASLPNFRLSEIMLVVWTQPWWEYLCQENQQAQQIRAPTPSVSCMRERRDPLQVHLSSGEHLLTHVALTRNFHLVEWIESWEARIYWMGRGVGGVVGSVEGESIRVVLNIF